MSGYDATTKFDKSHKVQLVIKYGLLNVQADTIGRQTV